MKKIIFAILLSTLYSLLSTLTFAQEEPRLPVSITGDNVEYFEEEKKAVAEGNVTILYQDMKLTSDKLTFYTETKEAIVEGNVTLYRKDGIFKGDRATYNFETQRGNVENARAEVDMWYASSKECKKVDENKYAVENGYITTCDAEHPHYKIQAKSLEIYPNDKVVAKNAVLYIWKIPVFYFPYYVHSMKQNVPNVSLTPGKNRDWGFYLLSKWRYQLDPKLKGNIRFDWREHRGVAPGLDAFYKTDEFGSGVFRAYYIEDQDKESMKREGRPRDVKNRYRFQLRHRWYASPKTTVTVEYHKASDSTFMRDFFFREEYEKDPQPPSYISVIQSEPAYTIKLRAQKRINKFETVTEYLPELALSTKSLRLGGTKFHYEGAGSFSNLTRKFATSDLDYDAQRLDLDNKLSYVEKVFGWLSVTPYVGTRQTYYSKDILNEEDLIRGIFYNGVDFSTRFYRVYGWKGKPLGVEINKIKHTINPTVKYFYQRRPTVNQNKLIQFDGVDSISRRNRVTLSLENYFQTKWTEGKDKELKIHDLARFVVGTDYIFREGGGRGRFGNLLFDLETVPYRWLSFGTDAAFNPRTGQFETYNLDALMKNKKETIKANFGYRYLNKSSAQLTSELSWQPTKKWLFRFYERYEFRGGRSREREFAIVRDLHCWETELGFNRSGPYGNTVFLIFRLKAFPEFNIPLRKTFPRPGTLTAKEGRGFFGARE